MLLRIFHAAQDLKGKPYASADKSFVLSILCANLFKDKECFHRVEFYTDQGELFSDTLGLYFVELKKLRDEKNITEMSAKERLMYYILNCQDKEKDSKIREIIERDEVIQVIDKRVDEIEAEYWRKLDEDFAAMHENERQVRIQKAEKKAKEQGLAEGRAEGRKEGRAEGRVEGRVEGLAEGSYEERRKNIKSLSTILSSQQIADTLNLSLDEVEDLLNS